MHAKLSQDLDRARERLNGLLQRELANFNTLLRNRDIGPLVAPSK
jgi:hypothetical protein